MPYRVCTFDSTGKILSVSPISYPDSTVVFNSGFLSTPSTYSLVDESLIPLEMLDGYSETETQVSMNGTDSSITIPSQRQAYDPRVEVTLFMSNPHPYMTRGSNILQDVTKAVAVYNLSDPTTLPVHTTSMFRTGGSSVKFTRSLTGYTGGFIYLTNLSKLASTGYNPTTPHNNIGDGATHSYAVEMYFYPTSQSNNFTLVQKGPTGASANWKMSYDSSAGQLQFAWQNYNTAGGYNSTQNIVNAAGMTVNQWHHVAVGVVRGTNSAGVTYLVSGYFNGTNRFSVGVTATTFPETRYSNGIYLGNNHLGTESFDGYIDMFRILESSGTAGMFGTAGYGFLPFGGGTLGVPTLAGFTRMSEAPIVMNFHGQPNSSQFYVESNDFISGTVVRITNLTLGATGVALATSAEVGVKDVVRYTLGYTAGSTGLSDPTGFTTNFGAIVKPFVPPFGLTVGSVGSTAHGIDYCFALNGVYDNNPDLNVYRVNYRNDGAYQYSIAASMIIEGASGNRGSSGSPMASVYGTNPFRRLFSGGAGNCYGGANAYTALFIDPTNSSMMSYILDNGLLATQGVCLAAYSFVDARGIARNLNATEISNLRLDLLEYSNTVKTAFTTLVSATRTAATKNAVKNSKFNDYDGKIKGSVKNTNLGELDGGGFLG